MPDVVAYQQTPHAPARPGRPVRGGALWRARRIVLVVRLVLVVLAVVSGVFAARTVDTDLAVSDMWTYVLLAAVVAMPLGGLVWWVEPSTPATWRPRERARTAGRWTRAVLAAGGLALAAYGALAESVGLTVFAVLLAVVSPVAYLVITAVGNAVSPPVRAPPPELEQRHRNLRAARETIVTRTRYGWSPPRSREQLRVVDSAGWRMMDIELYGWTRSELVTLARAAGLGLDRYAPKDRQHAVPKNAHDQAPTTLDRAIPKVPTHRTVRGRSLWRDALAATRSW